MGLFEWFNSIILIFYLKFKCTDKQNAGESCAQWYGDHIFKTFVDVLDYKGKDMKMYQGTWTYVQIKAFCDGIENYVC